MTAANLKKAMLSNSITQTHSVIVDEINAIKTFTTSLPLLLWPVNMFKASNISTIHYSTLRENIIFLRHNCILDNITRHGRDKLALNFNRHEFVILKPLSWTIRGSACKLSSFSHEFWHLSLPRLIAVDIQATSQSVMLHVHFPVKVTQL